MYLGIDIASVDGNKLVDWTAARAAGVRFAVFRGTYKTWIDPTWAKEAARCRAAGIVVGAYLFPVMALDAPSAVEQVGTLASALGPIPLGDLAPTLDVEFPGGIAKTGRSRSELLAWVVEAVTEMRRVFRVTPMIYTSARVWDGEDADSLNADELADLPPGITGLVECPLWLARYPYKTRIDAVTEASTVDALALPPVPEAWGPSNVWIHQYQGDALRLSGFTSTADLNRFFDLRIGSTGDRCKWLQRRLGLSQDGIFGPNTHKAVEDYQRVNGLTVDGIVGPRTFAYLSRIKLAQS